MLWQQKCKSAENRQSRDDCANCARRSETNHCHCDCQPKHSHGANHRSFHDRKYGPAHWYCVDNFLMDNATDQPRTHRQIIEHRRCGDQLPHFEKADSSKRAHESIKHSARANEISNRCRNSPSDQPSIRSSDDCAKLIQCWCASHDCGDGCAQKRNTNNKSNCTQYFL